MLHTRFTYREHIFRTAEKEVEVADLLCRIMDSGGVQLTNIRRLLLIALMVLGFGLQHDMYRKRTTAVQIKCALGVTCSYRTVSELASLVVAAVIPIDLLAQERKFIHWTVKSLGRKGENMLFAEGGPPG